MNPFLQSKSCALIVLASCACTVVQAEDTKKQNKQDSNKVEPELVLEYSSVFDDYIPFDDDSDIGWKEANDLVGEFGGWREYARLVQEEARKQAEQESQDDGGKK